jgi:hypothetical protein
MGMMLVPSLVLAFYSMLPLGCPRRRESKISTITIY